MKIVYAASRPEDVGGGETKVAFDFARQMAKHHQVLIVHPSQYEDTIIEKEGNLTKYGIKSVENGNVYTPKLDLGEIKKFKRYLERFDPDIAHSQTFIWLGQVLQDWAIKNKTPFFYTTHILPSKAAEWTDVDSVKSLVRRFTDSGLFRDYVASFYNSCSVIITLNQESDNDLQKFGYKGISYIIPNGAPLERFSKLRQADPEDKDIKLLYIASISVRKRQMFLLEAMTHLPKNYHLYFAGAVDVDQTYEEKVKEYIRKHKLDNVHMLGKVSYDKIPEILEDMHYFVSASTAEVQSLAIIEALAAGKPIVSIENETTRELVSEKNGVVLDKGTTPGEFADELMKFHENRDRYSEMSKNAKEIAKMFDFDTVVARTVDVYEAHLDSAPEKNAKVSSQVLATGIIAGTVALYLGVKAYKKARRR